MVLSIFIVWMGIGIVTGIIASRLLPRPPLFGTPGDIFFGILGSIVTGYLVWLLGFRAETPIVITTAMALIGSSLFLTAMRNHS